MLIITARDTGDKDYISYERLKVAIAILLSPYSLLHYITVAINRQW